jgi:uncharacterized protein with von Willebrand factor type A (vWA) domain
MKEDLLANGDFEQAMQKAFRWGYDDDGDEIPGLKDILQRVREDRKAFEEQASFDGTTALESSGELRELDQETAEGADEPGPADEALDLCGRIERMEQMERSLKQIESIDDLAGLDPQLVDTVLTDDEREWIEQWMSMTGRLVQDGLIVEGASRLELSPEAVRRIGAHALRSMYAPMEQEGAGQHELYRKGTRGATTDTSSPWEFGQPFSLHLTRTILNAVHRGGFEDRIALTPDDFETLDREATSASATVLMIDLSRSMFHSGSWEAAKRSALALDALMRIQYPRDELHIVGFSGTAELLHLMQLPSLTWDEFSHGTNMQAGLAMARTLLRDYGSMNRQIVVITDGEPTAFTEHGETIFENPATDRTHDATMREVVRCTRDRIGITTFLLDQSPQLLDFVARMTRINRGRVIRATPDRLGRYLVHDFANQRRSVVG